MDVGAVTDATSASVPGATVTATHVGTGLVRTAVTDAAGSYAFSEPTGTAAAPTTTCWTART
jgi:hypothetical protein